MSCRSDRADRTCRACRRSGSLSPDATLNSPITRSGGAARQRVPELPVARPCPHRVAAERSGLDGHLDAVVETRRQLPDDARADRRRRSGARPRRSPDERCVAPDEDVRLDRALRNERGGRGVRAEEAVAVAALVELPVHDAHDRGRRTRRAAAGLPRTSTRAPSNVRAVFSQLTWPTSRCSP